MKKIKSKRKKENRVRVETKEVNIGSQLNRDITE